MAERAERFAESAEALAHLLAVLYGTAQQLRYWGSDEDAAVLEAHAAQLARGREWPGDPVRSPFPSSLRAVGVEHHGGEE